MAHGGIRNGAGRKPVAIEDNVKEAIKQALERSGPNTLNEIWSSVIDKAKKGSDKHQSIFFSYYYGKPKENLDTPTEMIINVIRKH
jgi:hypothetical protein